MITLRRHQRWLARFTLLVMVALAVWPTLLRVSAWQQALPSYLTALCGPQQTGASAGAPSPGSEAPAHAALDHCPLCALAHAPVVPAQAHTVVLLALRQAAPWVPPTSAPAPAPRLHAHPRGPPSTLA